MSSNKRYTIFLLLLTAVTSSCKKLIGIPASPPNSIAESIQFSDSATTLTAVAGVYAYASYGTGFGFNDGSLTVATALSSDEMLYNSNSDVDYNQLYTNNLTDLNGTVGYLWSNPYAALYQVNAVLNNVAASSKLSASFKKQIVAEMKTVRALYYFYGVNLFGPVPLVLSTDYNVTARQPRASVDSVYLQILDDLSDAAKDLTPNHPFAGTDRPNLYTALALQSKVQLYRNQWQAAYDAAGQVISSGEYSLESDPNDVFLYGSSEAIWQLQGETSNSYVREAGLFIPYSSNTAPGELLTTSLLDAFENGDERRQDWVADYPVNGKDYYGAFKYKHPNSGLGGSPEGYMILRLAELYLIRAEAAAHLGKMTEAVDDINEVRERAGLDPTTAASEDDILKAVMQERRVELFTEWGNRWMDLKRTATIDAVLGAEKPGWQSYQALYPVPRSQRQANNLLSQNPGY